jgi:hypothetical protein
LCKYLIRPVYTKNAFSIVWPNFESRGTTRKASIFIGALTPGIKQKATSVRLSNPSYGLLEPGKVGRQKKERKKKSFNLGCTSQICVIRHNMYTDVK